MAEAAVVDIRDRIKELHANFEIVKVRLDVLKVDRSYQRDPSQTLVDKIAEDYDEISAELLLISKRGQREPAPEGGMFIINGQHRSLGAKKAGMNEVWARVLDLRNAPDPGEVEALFRLRTNVRLSDKPLERFKAQLRAGDPESAAIVAILELFNTEINDVPQVDVGINAVSTVEKLYRLDEGSTLRDTLQVIQDSFGYVGGKQAGAVMMSAIAWFITKHEEADRGRMVERLSAIGMKQMEQRARTIQASMSGPLWVNMYRAFIEVYNEKLQAKQRIDWRMGGSSIFAVRNRKES